MDKYIEPQITDYGSIAEMTAGRHFHKFADAEIGVNGELENASTGPCFKGFHESPEGSGHCVL